MAVAQTLTKLYVGDAGAAAFKTACDLVDVVNAGAPTTDLIVIPIGAGQVVVWKAVRA